MQTDYQIRTPIDTVILTVYGTSAEPMEYSLKDEGIIKCLIQRLNNLTMSNKKLMNKKELNKLKGISYKLEFIGKINYEYTILYGYCICNKDVYTIDNYDVFINDLKISFHF